MREPDQVGRAAMGTAPVRHGGCAASVDVYDADGESGVAVNFVIAAGHLPTHVRRELVEAVFEMPELRESHHLRASFPLGDHELLASLREHCRALNARAAGSTCLVDGDLL